MRWFVIMWKQFESAKQKDYAELVRGDDPKVLLAQMMAHNAQKRLSTTEYKIVDMGALLDKHKLKLVDNISEEDLNDVTSRYKNLDVSEITEDVHQSVDFLMKSIDRMPLEELKSYAKKHNIKIPFEKQPDGSLNIDMFNFSANIKKFIVGMQQLDTAALEDSVKLKTKLDTTTTQDRKPIQKHPPVESTEAENVDEPALKEKDGPTATDSSEGEEVKLAE